MVPERGHITVMSLNWQGKILLAQPAPTMGNRCGGCVFRSDGQCAKPAELTAYDCVDTLRTDYKDIVWKDKQ